MDIRQKTEVTFGNVQVAHRSLNFKEKASRDLDILRCKTLVDFSDPPDNHGSSLGTLRSQSVVEDTVGKTRTRVRVPILGPTRQQTDLYMFKMAKQKLEKLERLRQSVIPIDGPVKQFSDPIISGDVALFEDKAANAVLLEAETHLKSGYPTIATSSMVARRNRVSIEKVDDTADIRFFSDLVKPMQYRWKFQKEKLKTITPSKHGFHQRSKSPTFQRLVEAHDKLQNLSGQVSETEEQCDERDFYDTQSETVCIKPTPLIRYVRSEPVSNHTSYAGSLPATNDNQLQRGYELKPEVRTIEPVKKPKEEMSVQYKIIEEKRTPTPVEEIPPSPPMSPPPKPHKHVQQEIKVEFKKLDSHSELHLFLPHIQDNNLRQETPEEPHRKGKIKLTLPAIEDLEIKTIDEDKYKLKRKHKTEHKKKRKHTHRVKSGIVDKEVTDILNDVPTLISLETDKDFHPESMCMFENCKLHRHRKSNRIRQA